ncbi:MAG: hypothetical protein COV78_01215 [Candidatus Pacebacteria bacterium CG11_big_fil_rev_8_21_14_0_20_34_55]|nr:MAG: hypothetical protein COV78_01215 [Candidatus Pacebacteria bacterium CG11_big_fil_rev_8_21_14_0_20_34_55]PJC44156.1 MAG: hypothetical protein CO039_00315 [Candidatus Pacebacteria bacterium CG_4_9_14_0_2_um_filter_34_50]
MNINDEVEGAGLAMSVSEEKAKNILSADELNQPTDLEKLFLLVNSEERRARFENQNPQGELDKKVYGGFARAFSDNVDDYAYFEKPWEIHLQRILQQHELAVLLKLYQFLTLNTQKDPTIEEERIVLVKEICNKVSYLNFDSAGISIDADDPDHSVLIIDDSSLGEVHIALFTQTEEGIKKIYHQQVKEYSKPTDIYRFKHAQEIRESIYQHSDDLDAQFELKYSNMVPFDLEGLVNVEHIALIIKQFQEDDIEEIEYGLHEYDYRVTRELVRTAGEHLEELEDKFRSCSSEELFKIEVEIGTTLGKMARRSVEPPLGKMLVLVKHVARKSEISKVFQQVIGKESEFWGKNFDPIHDAIVLDFKLMPGQEGRVFRSIEEEIEWAKFLSEHTLDMTRCNDDPTLGTDLNNYSFSMPQHGEETNNEGPGIYFGILGGFRDWGHPRAIIHNMPMSLTVHNRLNNQLMLGGYVSIPGWRLTFTKSALIEGTGADADFVIDGGQIVAEAWDPSKHDYDSVEESPHFKKIISPELLSLFQKFFPGAKMEYRDVGINGEAVPLPFIVLPQGTPPFVYGTLMDRFGLPNVICDFGNFIGD